MAITMVGRRSVFRGKKGGMRIQGVLTAAGGKEFEARRRELAKLIGWLPEELSDADVIEYLTRGPEATIEALHAIPRQK